MILENNGKTTKSVQLIHLEVYHKILIMCNTKRSLPMASFTSWRAEQ